MHVLLSEQEMPDIQYTLLLRGLWLNAYWARILGFRILKTSDSFLSRVWKEPKYNAMQVHWLMNRLPFLFSVVNQICPVHDFPRTGFGADRALPGTGSEPGEASAVLLHSHLQEENVTSAWGHANLYRSVTSRQQTYGLGCEPPHRSYKSYVISTVTEA